MEATQASWPLRDEPLVEKALVARAELEAGPAEQGTSARRSGEIPVAQGLVSGLALTAVLAEQLGVELVTERGLRSGLFAEIARRPAELERRLQAESAARPARVKRA